MFKKLMELAQQGDFTLAVRAVPNDKTLLTVIVAPLAKEGQDPALSQPFRMTGTVDELEANFASTMDRFIGAREALTEQLDATLAILEEAKKNSAKKATDALHGKARKAAAAAPAGAPAAAGTASTGFAEEDEEDAAQETGAAREHSGATQASAAPATSHATATVGNLFG